jgi:hypothetical protein
VVCRRHCEADRRGRSRGDDDPDHVTVGSFVDNHPDPRAHDDTRADDTRASGDRSSDHHPDDLAAGHDDDIPANDHDDDLRRDRRRGLLSSRSSAAYGRGLDRSSERLFTVERRRRTVIACPRDPMTSTR